MLLDLCEWAYAPSRVEFLQYEITQSVGELVDNFETPHATQKYDSKSFFYLSLIQSI